MLNSLDERATLSPSTLLHSISIPVCPQIWNYLRLTGIREVVNVLEFQTFKDPTKT